MTAQLVARVFRTAGIAAPSGLLARTLARAPRARLVRAVAWLGCAGDGTDGLIRGVRLVLRGWDDVYSTSSVPRSARAADIEKPAPGQALVIRSPRFGRGWTKEALPSLGNVRPEVDLAVAWLTRGVGCVMHEDCVAIPALGAACLEASLAD